MNFVSLSLSLSPSLSLSWFLSAYCAVIPSLLFFFTFIFYLASFFFFSGLAPSTHYFVTTLSFVITLLKNLKVSASHMISLRTR